MPGGIWRVSSPAAGSKGVQQILHSRTARGKTRRASATSRNGRRSRRWVPPSRIGHAAGQRVAGGEPFGRAHAEAFVGPKDVADAENENAGVLPIHQGVVSPRRLPVGRRPPRRLCPRSRAPPVPVPRPALRLQCFEKVSGTAAMRSPPGSQIFLPAVTEAGKKASTSQRPGPPKTQRAARRAGGSRRAGWPRAGHTRGFFGRGAEAMAAGKRPARLRPGRGEGAGGRAVRRGAGGDPGGKAHASEDPRCAGWPSSPRR